MHEYDRIAASGASDEPLESRVIRCSRGASIDIRVPRARNAARAWSIELGSARAVGAADEASLDVRILAATSRRHEDDRGQI
jgi:hypothetical protein